MRAASPVESCHVQTAGELLAEGARVLACTRADELVAVGAYKRIAPGHAELKSMHTVADVRGLGVGRAILRAILDAARHDGHRQISLETGTADFFAAARRLYAAHGFRECPPFGDYREDPLSVFMTRRL